MVIDLTTDKGFDTFISLIKEGKLNRLDPNLDLDMLIQKQAYAEESSFADPENKMFSIASKDEIDISARYAEKCASEINPTVLDSINEACLIFGVEPLNIQVKTAQANEMFTECISESEKYASSTEYGTELDVCLAARALHYPEVAEELEELAKLASTIAPRDMVNIIQEIDSNLGTDLPWIQQQFGSPEYAVFEKRASMLKVDFGSKQIDLEKLAECQEVLESFGVDIDFDENDPYTTKLALERLPRQIKDAIAKALG